jgi:hypothetical protein
MKLDMPSLVKAPGKGCGRNAKADKECEDKSGEEKPITKQDMSKVKSFICGKKGHIAPNFPEKDQEDEQEEQEPKRKQFVTWEDEQYDDEVAELGAYVTYEVYESVRSPPKFGKYDILLNNQADASIVHPCMLCDVLPADLPVSVKGIGGKQLKAEHTDYLQEFFRVYASEQANPSVLSLSDVEDFYRVTYVTGGAFILHLPSYDLAFKRTGKLYVPIVGKF